jgi:hypothetical protein
MYMYVKINGSITKEALISDLWLGRNETKVTDKPLKVESIHKSAIKWKS